jgi:hypothetical protein
MNRVKAFYLALDRMIGQEGQAYMGASVVSQR